MCYLLLPILVHMIKYDLTIEGELGVRIFLKYFLQSTALMICGICLGVKKKSRRKLQLHLFF